MTREFGPTFNGITLPEAVFLPPEVLQAMPYMTGAELKVTVAALSRTATIGGGEPITLDDFETLTGLSRPAVLSGLKRALTRGILTRYPIQRSPGHHTYVYDLAVAPPNADQQLKKLTDQQLKKFTVAPPVKLRVKRVVVVNSQEEEEQQQLLTPEEKIFLSPQKFFQETVLTLRQLGVYPRIAAEMAASVPADRLQAAIRLYRLALQHGVADGPGWLVTLLRDAHRDPETELADLQTQIENAETPFSPESALPEDIREQVEALNWTGALDEVAAAWEEDAERVRNLLAFAQRHHLKAGWLRTALREGFWPPEDELLPETRARRQQEAHRRSWEACLAAAGDDDGEPAPLPPHLTDAWQALQSQAQALPEGRVWFSGLTPWRLEDGTLWLRATNPAVAAWFQQHARPLAEMLNAHLPQPIRLVLDTPSLPEPLPVVQEDGNA